VRVLVSGGGGFIGRHLVRGLAARHEVLAPTHAELELTDADTVKRWLHAHKVDAVVHAAVKPGHRNATDLAGLCEANLRQFCSLLRCRVDFGRFVVVSSGAVYGVQRPLAGVGEAALGETVPADEHGFSKYIEACLLAGDDDAVELRPFGVYGPGEDYAIRFVSNACCKALFGLPITLRRDRCFSYVWVDDVATVVERALARPAAGGLAPGAYNVTPVAPVRLSEVAKMVVAISGKRVPIVVADDGPGLDYHGDGGRLQAALPGWTPTSMTEGITDLYRWYADHRDMVDRAALLVDR
jgi:UDP-glucose 4-epimerase